MESSTTNQTKVNSDINVLEQLTVMSADVNRLKEKCAGLRRLLDEGTYKIDSLLNVVNNLKTKEQNIAAAGGDQAVLQQMNEEQINGFLEMLKSPAFQNLARQMLIKWANVSQTQDNSK